MAEDTRQRAAGDLTGRVAVVAVTAGDTAGDSANVTA